jgi:hypothetical protein
MTLLLEVWRRLWIPHPQKGESGFICCGGALSKNDRFSRGVGALNQQPLDLSNQV